MSANPTKQPSSTRKRRGAKPAEPAAAPRPAVPAKVLDALIGISGSVNVDDLVDQAISAIRNLWRGAAASVWWLERDKVTLVRSSRPLKQRSLAVGRQAGIRKALETEQPVIARSKALGSGDLLVCPISDRFQEFGVLVIDFGKSGITPERELVAEAIARQMAIAVVNSARLRQLLDSNTTSQVQTQKLQNLYQVLDRFSRVRSEETLLKMIPKLACSALGYHYAVIERIRGKRLDLIHIATQPPADPEFVKLIESNRVRDLLSAQLVKQAIASKQPVSIDDPSQDEKISRRFIKRSVCNLAVVPLIDDEGGVAAILHVAHHRVPHQPPERLKPADLELLNVFSKFCIFALASIRYANYRRQGIDIAKIPARSVDEFTEAVVTKLPGIVGGKDAVIALPGSTGVLEPVATTNPKLLTAGYRTWLADLPFRRYGFRLPGVILKQHRSIRHLENSMTAPILYENETMGMVHIFNRISGNFTSKDLALMRMITSRIGYVLKNLEFVHRLSREKQQFSSIVHNTADGILSMDGRQRIKFFNHAMEDITGYKASEVIGITAREVFDPRDESDASFDFRTLQERHDLNVAQTVNIRTQPGDRKWVGITATPQVSVEGTKLTILVIRDITEEHALRQRQQEFVSIASHELRTPITALIGYLSLIESEQAADPEQRKHFVSRAYSAATRLSELVEDLLSVARIEEGRVALNLNPVHPGEVAAEVVSGLTQAAEAKGQRLTFKNALKKADVIEADRSKLHQVVANLVDNAIKYTPEKGRVTVTAQASKRSVTVTVADNGIGIHPENLARIFDKFFREYTELSVAAGGTGLGLFITKELVERQGGSLHVQSNQGKGTTARVRFPRATRSKKR